MKRHKKRRQKSAQEPLALPIKTVCIPDRSNSNGYIFDCDTGLVLEPRDRRANARWQRKFARKQKRDQRKHKGV